ncbi:hypothetical protein SESBI_18673 [Sesbania bispinosa]|nr:hypothetical protein SESBI_18673 [Sesbania bispinosa]
MEIEKEQNRSEKNFLMVTKARENADGARQGRRREISHHFTREEGKCRRTEAEEEEEGKTVWRTVGLRLKQLWLLMATVAGKLKLQHHPCAKEE